MKNYTFSSRKLQAHCSLFFLQVLIPAHGHFDPSLSLALDAALLAVEGAP